MTMAAVTATATPSQTTSTAVAGPRRMAASSIEPHRPIIRASSEVLDLLITSIAAHSTMVRTICLRLVEPASSAAMAARAP